MTDRGYFRVVLPMLLDHDPATDPLPAQARSCTTLKWSGTGVRPHRDAIAVEEPLEIRLGGRRFTLTMRTPAHDEELAAGFLLAEGFIDAFDEVGEMRRVPDRKGSPEPNILDVILRLPQDKLRERLRRNFVTSSSCGVCGKTSIEAIRRRVTPITGGERISAAVLCRLGPRFSGAQEVFAATGGLHAAGLFTWSGGSHMRSGQRRNAGDGVELIALREDVGRHNAVDKVIGYALMRDMLPLKRALLMVSGRLSFEIVQKAAVAGVPILVAVSAPSSLAVDLAEEVGITLIGFMRGSSFNVYTHPRRVIGCAA